MKAYFLALIGGLSVFSTVLNAQYNPLPYPSELPPEPLSRAGEYQRQKSSREFYEMWGAHFRASEEAALAAIRERRGEAQEAREFARQEKIEQTRANNLARRVAREQQIASQAQGLLAAIRNGSVRWPSALEGDWARKRVDELIVLLKKNEPVRGEDARRLTDITAELRQAIRNKVLGTDHNQRVQAAEVVVLLQAIAEHTQRTLVARQ